MIFVQWIRRASLCAHAGSTLLLAIVLFAAAGCKKEEVTNVTNIYTAEDLTNAAIQPQISSTYPVNGTVGPFNVFNRGAGSGKAHFVLVFNKLIFKNSINSKTVRVKGFDRPVIAYLQTPGSGNYDNVLSFLIRDSLLGPNLPYPVAQACTVTVDSTFEDVNGNHFASPFTFSFTPEPFFRVVSFSPRDGSTDVQIGTTPSVVFNSAVNNGIISSLQIAPDPGGSWKMFSNDSLSVYFSVTGRNLPFNTSFTVTARSDAHDAAGRLINSQFTSRFSSVAFRVGSTFPFNGQTRVFLNPSIESDFTGPIDSGTVRGAFSINPATPGTFFLSTFSYFQFYCYPVSLRQNTTYTVSVSSLLRSSNGTAVAPYTITFTTDRFNVSSTFPDDGSTNINRFSSISVFLNGNIDTSTVRSAFSISPSVPSGSLVLNDPDNSFSFANDGLAANTTYTVTISTGLRTNAGDHLLSPYSFSFTTQP